MDRCQERRDKLRHDLKKTGVDALLVTNFVNVTYLTGFTGDDSYLLVRHDGQVLLSDPRYTTQLGEECADLDLHIRRPGASMLQSVLKVLDSAGVHRLGIEADSMSVSLWDRIAGKLPNTELVPTSGMVEKLRLIKDRDEIAQIRKAIWQAEKAFGVLRAALRLEQTEKELADELEHQYRLFGAKDCGFPSIVAVGPRAALPHAAPTRKRVGEGEMLLVDWGANERLYKSDLTRVLAVGKISPKLRRVHGVVLDAQTQAIAAIRPGMPAQEVDAVARGIIADAGYGRNFGHGLGHGIGLEVHEGPRLAAKSPTILRPGMVVTVEPGIYLPGWGGVRIEDDVLVTRSGREVLTSVPRQLEHVIVN